MSAKNTKLRSLIRRCLLTKYATSSTFSRMIFCMDVVRVANEYPGIGGPNEHAKLAAMCVINASRQKRLL